MIEPEIVASDCLFRQFCLPAQAFFDVESRKSQELHGGALLT
jgi:hypothetical protein